MPTVRLSAAVYVPSPWSLGVIAGPSFTRIRNASPPRAIRLPNASNAVIVILAGSWDDSTQPGTSAADLPGSVGPARTALEKGEPLTAVPDTRTCTRSVPAFVGVYPAV